MNNFESLIIRLRSILESKSEDIIKIRNILDTIKEKEIEYLDNNYNNFMKMKKTSGLDSPWTTRSEHEALIRKQQMMDSEFMSNKRDMRILDSGINSLYKDLVPYISNEYNEAIVQINDFSYEFDLNISSQHSLLKEDYIVFSNHTLDYYEKLSYRKIILNHFFIVNFTLEDNSKEKISNIEITVIPDSYDGEFAIKIKVIPEIIIDSISNSKTDFMIVNKINNKYLNSLKIHDLFTLDSKEHNEISLIATDFPFKFESDELYEIFKIGFSQLIQIIENDLENNVQKKVKKQRVTK